MPKSTVVEDSPYPIPEDTLCPAQLNKCEALNIKFNKKDGTGESSFQKWEWTFLITDGEFAGQEIRTSTEPKITNASESSFLPLARPFVEALLGRALEIGEDIDTDELLGLPCQLTVRHLPPRERKTGDGFWFNVEVSELFPAYLGNAAANTPAFNKIPF